ncbi:hypothetical protein [Cupriavidus sp. TMH.W2]|uniref:hypothetical protein n=1 Tax=Cupriavidus sp. TMH.W2 TaxID=3434465 RepID=UPI003D770958
MAQPLTRFFFLLHAPTHVHPESFVEAKNKTEARALIARAYRAETPRAATASGYTPFHHCRIEWTREEPVLPSVHARGWDEVDAPDDEEHPTLTPPLTPLEAEAVRSEGVTVLPPSLRDPGIGVLMRDGKAVYYHYRDSDYQHGYHEGSLLTVVRALGEVRHAA